MFRGKKMIVGGVLAAVILVGSIGGVVLAQTENGNSSPPELRCGAFISQVCDSYNTANPDAPIDCDELDVAFNTAREQMRSEVRQNCPELDTEAMKDRLQSLLAEGKITQEQFDKKIEWIESMPDNLPGFGFKGHRGFRGMGGMRGFGGLCAPPSE